MKKYYVYILCVPGCLSLMLNGGLIDAEKITRTAAQLIDPAVSIHEKKAQWEELLKNESGSRFDQNALTYVLTHIPITPIESPILSVWREAQSERPCIPYLKKICLELQKLTTPTWHVHLIACALMYHHQMPQEEQKLLQEAVNHRYSSHFLDGESDNSNTPHFMSHYTWPMAEKLQKMHARAFDCSKEGPLFFFTLFNCQSNPIPAYHKEICAMLHHMLTHIPKHLTLSTNIALCALCKQAKMDPNMPNDDGDTLLHTLLKNNRSIQQIEVLAEVLLACGIDPKRINKAEQTAYAIAQEKGKNSKKAQNLIDLLRAT